MVTLTLAVGAVLTLAGIIAYVVTDFASVTALIPAFVGVLILAAGLVARKDSLRRHAIHGALAIALLGVLGSLMNVVRIGELFAGTAERPAAIVVSLIMFVVLAVYLAFGVRSFIAVRRARNATPR